MSEPAIDPAVAAALRELGSPDGTGLCIDGVAASTLVATFGTPLYVFSAAVLRRRVAAVKAALGPRVDLLWSVKANPSVQVTRCLREAGAGIEVASLGELQVALAAGHDAAAVRFAGPGKTDAELQVAIDQDLCLHVESADELAAIDRLAAAAGRTARLALRVNFAAEVQGSRLRMGGRSSRFGIDQEQVPALLQLIAASPALHLVGAHVYGGTQCFDAGAFVRQAAALCEAVRGWEADGARLDELDLGGGFGVAAFLGDGSFDLATAGRELQALIRSHDRPGRRWFVELGRFLAAPAGVYLTRVVRRKQSGGTTQVAVDGGLHQHAAAAGVGTIVRRSPLLVRAAAPWAAGTTPVTVGGPLCTPQDQFADQLPLGPLAAGELLAVLHAGAYGLTFSPHAFLSHATPAEVLVDRGEAHLVRHRGAPADALRGQVR